MTIKNINRYITLIYREKMYQSHTTMDIFKNVKLKRC